MAKAIQTSSEPASDGALYATGTDSPARRVGIFDTEAQTRELAAQLGGLGYEALPIVSPTPPGDWLAHIVNAEADPDLERTRLLARHHPVILIDPVQSFQSNLAAVRAGASASVGAPPDLAELGAWLAGLHTAQMRPFAILIVEDDEIAAQAYGLALEAAGMQTAIVTDVAQVFDEVARMAPDLILMDMNMPVANGMEVARVLRLAHKNLSTPIIFLSAETDKQRQHDARKIGGDDFIAKPVDLNTLGSLVEIRAQRARALRQVMDRDSLTGLLNHARFKDRVAHELSRALRTGLPFSLGLIDLDHFKAVNDRHGHLCGDKVLRTLAHALQGMLRGADVIARYGGEEFAVLLLDTDAAQAYKVMDKIRAAFGRLSFDGPKAPFSVTMSVGIAQASAGLTTEQIIQRADEALYLAKTSGRDRVVPAQAP